MSKAKNNTENQAPEDHHEDPQVQMRALAQYIRDLSFENLIVQNGISGEIEPTMTVNVNLDARKGEEENQFEVMMKLNLHSKDKNSDKSLFLVELDYAGMFEILGVPEEQLHPFLLIECPRLMFPFARRIISDLTHDGGFAPFNLENIDFMQLYRHELMRRQQMQEQGQEHAVEGNA